MSGDPILLIAAHPTRGVDVGAQAAIWDHIKAARRHGLAVLLISADLDELIGLSDRIEVILRGKLVGTFDPDDVTPEQLGSAMTGAGAVTRASPSCSGRAQRAPAGPRGGVRDHQPGAERRRRPGDRGVGPAPVGPRDPQRRQHHRQRDRPLPLRPGRGHRLPDEPVQHRRRRPVPHRGVRRGASWPARPGSPATSTPPSRWSAAMAVGALWAGIAGRPAGDPRSQRGHLDDHAERDRHRFSWPTCCARRRSGGGQQRHRDEDRSPRRAGSPTSRSATVRPSSTSTASSSSRSSSGFLYWFVLNKTRFGFDLRATGRSTTAAVASGISVTKMTVAAMLLSGAVAGPGGPPDPAGVVVLLRLDVPVRPRLRRHRDRPAGPQQRRRHRDRRAAVRLPQRAVQPAADRGRRLAGHRGHHPGRDRADRRHLLRDRQALRRPPRAAVGRPSARQDASERRRCTA